MSAWRIVITVEPNPARPAEQVARWHVESDTEPGPSVGDVLAALEATKQQVLAMRVPIAAPQSAP